MQQTAQLEQHPWQPFLPGHTRLIMLGSFPPAKNRWCMDFFYPNYINDMWRIFGLCLYGDKLRFVDEDNRKFRLDDIKAMLEQYGVGLYDTAKVVRRTRNTAADKDLEVVCEVDLYGLIDSAPECVAVVTTGQKATDIFCRKYDIAQPKVGDFVPFTHGDRHLRLYRMPSSSRAYPMRLEKKAEAYQILFDQIINKNKTIL